MLCPIKLCYDVYQVVFGYITSLIIQQREIIQILKRLIRNPQIYIVQQYQDDVCSKRILQTSSYLRTKLNNILKQQLKNQSNKQFNYNSFLIIILLTKSIYPLNILNLITIITMQTNQPTYPDKQPLNNSQILQTHIKSKTNPKEMAEMLIKYIMQTHFVQYLRNNYHFFHEFTKKDLKILFKTGEIFRIKKAHSNMIINFNQPTICILVFGSVSLEGKLYSKGEFFIAVNDRIEMFFSNKTTMAMLHKQDLQNKLYELENYYFKKKQIQKILPLDLLFLSKPQIQKLIEVSESLESSATNKVLNKSSDKNKGVYLLYEGVYSMKSSEDVPFTEITCDYFGEQILWSEGYEYSIQANTCPFRFIFLLKQDLLQILNYQNIDILKQIYTKKVELRKKMAKQIEDNLEFTKKMIKKMEISYKNNQSKTQYKEFKGKVCRNPINKQWIIQKTKEGRLKVAHCSPKINNEMSSPQTIQIEDKDQFSDNRQNNNLNNFTKTIYKSQKAQIQRLFRKRVHTQGNDRLEINSKKRSQLGESERQKKQKYSTEKSELDMLPKTLSVLMKYYESTKKIKGESLDLKQKDDRAFLASAKSRRLATNIKLHQQIFYKQFLQIKNEQNRAFKTWR